MAANMNSQAQVLMLLNQVTNLENQLKMGRMPQNGMNSNNLLSAMSQLNTPQRKMPANRNDQRGNRGPNLANLLAAINGDATPNRTRYVWVMGLPVDYQDADKLLNIFGNFGNVQRIIFTEKKPDGALIELDDSRAAYKAVLCMRGQKLDGQNIKISYARFDNTPGLKDDGKSMDVRKAKENWRYAKDGKFRRIIMSRLKKLAPKVLVSNLPEGKLDLLKKHIIEAGYTVHSIEETQRPDGKDKPSTGYITAIVDLASVEEAIGAVANLHNSWPKKFGTKKKDARENDRGLAFSLTGIKAEKSKA